MPFRIDTSVPYGNAADTVVSDANGIVEVRFTPDPHGGPEVQWFCFRITGQRDSDDQKLRLVLRNPQNMLGCSKPAVLRPVIRYGGDEWFRLGEGTVAELPDGRIDVSWVVDAPERFADVAWCYPYGRPELELLLHQTFTELRGDTIGVSQGGRPLVRISNDYGRVGGSRPGVYLVARQHAGETPGSWVLDGLLRAIIELGDRAPLVWAIPFANIDGIEQGDYGKDAYPYDINRAWGAPPMRHETLVIQQDIERWKSRCRPMLAIDFHAPGASETDGLYAYVPDSGQFPTIHQKTCQWTAAIKLAMGDRFASPIFERVARYPSRWDTPHLISYLWQQHSVCGFAIETPYGQIGQRALTRQDYQEAGRRIAGALVGQEVG